MTEQPDTAAIRATRTGPNYMYHQCQCVSLCDALDAARAERDEVKGLLDDKSRRDDTALMAYKREKARAEAAEADNAVLAALRVIADQRAEAAELAEKRMAGNLAHQIAMREAAEARIAAAKAMLDWPHLDREVLRRALTGGTK